VAAGVAFAAVIGSLVWFIAILNGPTAKQRLAARVADHEREGAIGTAAERLAAEYQAKLREVPAAAAFAQASHDWRRVVAPCPSVSLGPCPNGVQVEVDTATVRRSVGSEPGRISVVVAGLLSPSHEARIYYDCNGLAWIGNGPIPASSRRPDTVGYRIEYMVCGSARH
jgi:hypothetical protein